MIQLAQIKRQKIVTLTTQHEPKSIECLCDLPESTANTLPKVQSIRVTSFQRMAANEKRNQQ